MIKVEKIENEKYYQYTIDGKIDKVGITNLKNVFSQNLESDDRFRILGIIKNIDGFEDINTIVDSIKIDFLAGGKIEKYAILTEKAWIEKIAEVSDTFTPRVNIKVFDLDEKREALNWLKSDH